ncbi:MAG: hypothetical protein EHM35_19100 [Planctomycetaceae bacterium]|nr:MAG: hypothetical protein EHM35_19100 [Planctomycetaceae bacterium]
MKHDQQMQENPYMTAVPLDRVRSDALYGVRLARLAWRARDPEGAAKELGRIIEPGHEHELTRHPQRTQAPTGKRARRKVGKKTPRTKRRSTK